ncbi:MAG: ATP-dependent DNA/RNA helicase [Caeruleum heppii]|nr:MAG: ATP-dependent DNA/RNA helicase [Caeruleum heppii]
MKRKLDDNEVPKEVSSSATPRKTNGSSFASLDLDPRLLQAIVDENYASPTPVQAKAIPLALEGKDILARAKTGTGKTAAYLLPIIHSILKRKGIDTPQKRIAALILVPTDELANQVTKSIQSLSAFCAKDIRAANLNRKVSQEVQKALLADLPDIIIATPKRVALNMANSALSLHELQHLVIDEADLVLSFGHDEDLRTIAETVPKGLQTFLMSATLSEDLDTLKNLFCRDPIALKLEEDEEDESGVSQKMIKCGEDEKFLLIYVIFKLKLIKGKCIIFVGDIDRCYRLKLYLEQFGIKGCILNSELPVNSRIHVVEEFNKNVYDIIIATDEHEIVGDEDDEVEATRSETHEGETMMNKATDESPSVVIPKKKDAKDVAGKDKDIADTVDPESEPAKKKRKRPKRDKGYGISRGIDFQNVACVVNFDLPTTSKSYTHRIGRTARAGATGMALSFVVPKDLYRKHRPTTFPTAANDEVVLEKIVKSQKKRGKTVDPFNLDMKQVAPFRYRMDDALRAVTGLAVREARTRELRQELLKSEKLKRHFEENPDDLRHLVRHDAEIRSARTQAHLKHVPEYLLPAGGKQEVLNGGGNGQRNVGFVGIGRTSENGIRRARMNNRAKGRGGKKGVGGRRVDPLKSFKTRK